MRWTMLAALVVVACALGAAPQWADAVYPTVEKQMKLDEGMPMDQVRALLGDPDSVDQDSCVVGPELMQCRTWNYGKSGHRFRVVFRKDAAGWVVNKWSS
jgi:hypothetical protein